jgi:bacillithiol system protein YtxJ
MNSIRILEGKIALVTGTSSGLGRSIAEKFDVEHQSPQVLVINQGKCSYSATHWDISMDEIKPHL